MVDPERMKGPHSAHTSSRSWCVGASRWALLAVGTGLAAPRNHGTGTRVRSRVRWRYLPGAVTGRPERRAIESSLHNLFAYIRVCFDGNMNDKLQLVRYNVHLTEGQLRELQRIYKAQGVRAAEQIRRAIDTYLAAVASARPVVQP